MSILKKRRIDYLTDQQYNDLKKNDPKTFVRLQEHQQNYKKVNARIEKLKRDEVKTKNLKNELKEWSVFIGNPVKFHKERNKENILLIFSMHVSRT